MLKILVSFFTIMAVALTAGAEADLAPVFESFNLEAFKNPAYRLQIYPPIKEIFADQMPWNAIGKTHNAVTGTTCTAFVVAKNKIMTAQHCLRHCQKFEIHRNGKTENLKRCALVNPAQPPEPTYRLDYISNVNDFAPINKRELINVTRVTTTGQDQAFDRWLPENYKDTLATSQFDWTILELSHDIQDPRVHPLAISDLSATQIVQQARERKIKFFVPSYPFSQINKHLNVDMLRLTAPCVLQHMQNEIMEFICQVEPGSSGAPVMTIDEGGRMAVVGVVSKHLESIMYATHVRKSYLP